MTLMVLGIGLLGLTTGRVASYLVKEKKQNNEIVGNANKARAS